MNTIFKTLLAPVASIALMLVSASDLKAGHHDPPSLKVKVKFDTCNSGSFWHRPVHRHAFRFVYEQVWFAPVYETVVTGYTRCGTPITRRVLKTCGHYKTAVYKVCGCNHKEFMYYL